MIVVCVSSLDTRNILKVIAGINVSKCKPLTVKCRDNTLKNLSDYFSCIDNINFVYSLDSTDTASEKVILIESESDNSFKLPTSAMKQHYTSYIIKDISDNQFLSSWKFINIPVQMLIDMYAFYTNKNYQITNLDDTIVSYINEKTAPVDLVLNPVKVNILGCNPKYVYMKKVENDSFVPISKDIYISANYVLQNNIKLKDNGYLVIVGNFTGEIYGEIVPYTDFSDIVEINWVSSTDYIPLKNIKIKVGNTEQVAGIQYHLPLDKDVDDIKIIRYDNKNFYNHDGTYIMF